MAMIQAKQMLEHYLKLELEVSEALSTSKGDRSLVNQRLEVIIREREKWERRVAAEAAAAQGGRTGYALATFV